LFQVTIGNTQIHVQPRRRLQESVLCSIFATVPTSAGRAAFPCQPVVGRLVPGFAGC
jgi:hypothetical protein